MKYCPYCGTDLNDDMSFCHKCGKSQVWNTQIDNEKTSEVSSKQQTDNIRAANLESEIQPTCYVRRDFNIPVDRSENATQSSVVDVKIVPDTEIQIFHEKGTNNRKARIIAISIIAVFLCIGVLISLNVVLSSKKKYYNAVALIESKNYKEAFLILKEISGYKDSKLLKESIKSEYENETLKTVNVGETLFFGEYEQDNNINNGKEDIEWLVLDKQDSKILVISRYAIDCKPYHSVNMETSWDECSLRNWLNDTFLIGTFNDMELQMAKNRYVPADLNPECSNIQGYATHDKVFLLSIEETLKYFGSDENRKCIPTAYAKANGSWTSDTTAIDGKATCMWWMRTLGDSKSEASFVGGVGSIGYYGMEVEFEGGSVRPAMWIDYDLNDNSSKDWLTIEEYYDKYEEIEENQMVRCTGFVSSKFRSRMAIDGSIAYSIFVVGNKNDVLWYDIPEDFSGSSAVAGEEIKRKVLDFEVSKEVSDNLSIGDSIIFNFVPYKGFGEAQGSLKSIESINGQNVNIVNNMDDIYAAREKAEEEWFNSGKTLFDLIK